MRDRSLTPVARHVALARGAGGPASGDWILLVEDNLYDEALALRALRKSAGAEVVVARDGIEALDRLGDIDSSEGAAAVDGGPIAAALPRVVVLDLHLPRLDGFGVLRRLRARQATRLLPVVVMSSSGECQDVSTSYALGANSYIRKPVDFTEFVKIAGQIAFYWLKVNQACDDEGRG
jgi:two-component system response regulator